MFRRALFFAFGLIFFACSNDDAHQMDGMWQLQSIEYPNGSKVGVDTVFYSFQRETVFSFISLINEDSSAISYGYVDFPSSGTVHIAMDTTRAEDCNCLKNVAPNFLKLSGWGEYEKTFSIQLSDKKLEMRDNNGWIYSFKKH